jgi:hypothetical protein
MTQQSYPPNFAKNIASTTGKELAKVPFDKDVKFPAGVQAAIDRGETAFHKASRRKKSRAAANSNFITSVVDKEAQDRRDHRLNAKAQQSKGKRGQPPRLVRSRATQIVVDRLQAEGVLSGTSRDSQMNRLTREWLNNKATSSRDRAKSRRKQLTPDAVRDLLRKIKELDE